MGKKTCLFSLFIFLGSLFTFGQSHKGKQLKLEGGQQYTIEAGHTWKVDYSDLDKLYFCQDESCDQKIDYEAKVQQLREEMPDVEMKVKGNVWISGETTILIKKGKFLTVDQHRLAPNDK